MLCKINVLKIFEKFTGRHMCRSLVFNKVAGWNISQNSRENSCAVAEFLFKLQAEKNTQNSQGNICAGVSFLIKLQAGGTISISNCWYTCIFYCTSYNKIQAFCTIFFTPSVLLLITEKSSNCLHSVNIISNVVSCGDVLRKKIKI